MDCYTITINEDEDFEEDLIEEPAEETDLDFIEEEDLPQE